jgi:hypothetical protein
MNTVNRPKGISIWGHPGAVVVCAVFGIVMLVIALPDVRSARELHLGLIAGIGIGLPAVLIEKWLLRRYRDFYAEFYTTPAEKRLSWRLQKTNLLCALPLWLAMLADVVLARGISATALIGVSIMCMLFILGYPEQKAIYRAAKARIAQ